MKKTITLLLTLCLLLGLLPVEAAAFAGDIYRAGDVTQVKMADGSLSLQNGYVHVTLHKLFETYSYLTVVPTAKPDEDSMWNSQTPYCNYTTYNQGVPTTEGVVTELKSMTFVSETPNGKTNAIKAEYDLLSSHSHVAAQVTVYYEIVQLKESGPTAKDDTWGVLATVGSIRVDKDSLPKDQIRDFTFTWGYSFNCFTAMGHKDNLEKSGGPAIKISRTTVPQVPEGGTPKITTENTTITAFVEKLNTKTVPKGYSQWGEVDGIYITEAYVDSYPWANPFVGLSEYYGKEITASSGDPIRVNLAQFVSVQPGDKPLDTWVQCESYPGFTLEKASASEGFSHFLWGFRDLKTLKSEIPSEPDKVDPAIYAKRLAVFPNGAGVTVEHVADDAALEALKRQYKKDPVALISGDYKSTDGTSFEFTGGAALLSPSVTATWDKANGRLVIKKDGTVEQSGVNLSAPTFKFYQPKSGAEGALSISLTRDGFTFGIAPENNDAIVYVDIPYATVKLRNAAADAAGNLVFSGNIGFQTIFDGAEFSLEKLGYGLNEKKEFKVNGVHATGEFDTEKMLSLELAKVKGEVNTFKGKESYAFELELNVFDLFETKAELELTRSKRDGSLLPNTLYFYVASSPGIPLIPPVPIGQLNGGGAGFMDLAKTVNGDYFAIPPIKLRGTLTGTYLHLIEGTGDVVIGPSEISLTASDVGIVGAKLSIIDSFGYALKLNGQERKYGNETYTGIYFAGSEALELNLPSTELDVIVLKSSIELGAFGGVNENKDKLYLGIGANGKVQGILQIPSNFFIPCLRGAKLSQTDIQLIIGGQTTARISGVSVSEGMKDAFNNINVYLGAMAQTTNWLYDVRAWVILPNIIKTDFEKGKGWDLEGKLIKKLPEWKWEDHGVTPVVQAVSLEDGEEALMLTALEPVVLTNGSSENSKVIEVKVTDPAETPYILLAFDESVSEEDIKQALIVTKKDETNRIDINWVGEDGQINSTYEINAGTDLIENVDGNKYRVVLLRLKSGGTYEVNTDSLTLVREKSKGVTVTPFEKLGLNLNSSSGVVSGKIKYAEDDTTYTLRTYLAEEEGGADYLIDEQIVKDTQNISVTVPTSGTHAPTGSYYVTSSLNIFMQ